jgi:hypothetical protein
MNEEQQDIESALIAAGSTITPLARRESWELAQAWREV